MHSWQLAGGVGLALCGWLVCRFAAAAFPFRWRVPALARASGGGTLGAGLAARPLALGLDLAPVATLFLVLLCLVDRPLLAGAATLGIGLFFGVSDLSKRATLEEPLVFSDAAEAVLVVRHPQFYLPFVGLPLLIGGCILGFGLPILMIWAEPPLGLGLWGRIGLLVLAVLLAWPVMRMPAWLLHRLAPGLDPARAAAILGPLATYALTTAAAAAARPVVQALAAPRLLPRVNHAAARLPHVILLQMESFADARRYFPEGIAPGVLTQWDRLGAEALRRGPLQVPAFGANTMRAEFMATTGLGPEVLGLDHFNPYWRFGHRPTHSLAHVFAGAGAETVALHPFHPDFYDRRRMLPGLGFRHFRHQGSPAFQNVPLVGRYVADEAMARAMICELQGQAQPHFLFGITIQAHSPWPGDQLEAWSKHLAAADAMLGTLAAAAEDLDRPLVLCAYGDHLPPLGPMLAARGITDRTTDYLLWHSAHKGQGRVRTRSVASLYHAVLAAALLP